MKSALKLDVADLRILEAVQQNARITKLALAEQVGLSPTPCWLRLRKLEEAGVVTAITRALPIAKSPPLRMSWFRSRSVITARAILTALSAQLLSFPKLSRAGRSVEA